MRVRKDGMEGAGVPSNTKDFNQYTKRSGALAETFPRHTLGGSTKILSSGTLYLMAISINEAMTITSITFVSGNTALSVPSNLWFALYTSGFGLVGQTADQGVGATWAASSEKTIALTAPKAIPPGLYYIGINCVATTPPNLIATTQTVTYSGLAPALAGNSDSSLTTTAPASATAVTGDTRIAYAWVS